MKYRDQRRATATQTRVNIEGQIVWTQECLRYRINACGDFEAQDKVFASQLTAIGEPASHSASIRA